MTTIDVDGKKLKVKDGDNLLDACLSHQLDLPYFCWHPAMGSVGSCRQCAVRVYADDKDTRGRILMACMTPVQNGMRLSINEEGVSKFRDKSIEVTMANHPHDCPVCEEGGECHLQDMTIMSQHTSRRYRGSKKTYNNQYLGPCIGHEMNRCIACYRCVRFYNDYAGGKDLAVLASRENVYFGRYEDGCLESVFSGNLAEVCPTGVFTDKTLARSYTRKWDLQSAPSICDGCSMGCNTAPAERSGKIKRITNRYHGVVNGYFICDLGRYGYDYNNHPDRIRQSYIRNDDNEMTVAPYADAIKAVRDTFLDKKSLDKKGDEKGVLSGTVIGIGSDDASVEENFALRQLVGPGNFSSGLSRHRQAMLQDIVAIYQDPMIHCPTLKQIEKCDAVLVLGEDMLNSATRMALSVRQATRNLSFELATKSQIPLWQDAAVRTLAQEQRSPLIIASPMATELDEIASHTFRGEPAAIAQLATAITCGIKNENVPTTIDSNIAEQAKSIAKILVNAKNPVVISGMSLQSKATIGAAANIALALAEKSEQPANLCYVLPKSNSMGVALQDHQQSSLSLEQVLEKVTAKPQQYSLFVLQNDLYQQLNCIRIEQLFAACKHCVVLDQLPSKTTQHADVLLPAETKFETEGTLVNYEGRAQRFFEIYNADDADLKDNWKTLVNVARAVVNHHPSDIAHSHATLAALAEVQHFDDIVQLIAQQGGLFTKWNDIAPDHSFRIAGMKVARQFHRFSGRTSIYAQTKVAENQQPIDEDSALAFSMEGVPNNVPGKNIPASLNALTWSPGWNSNESVNKFQDEIGGPLRNGDSGLILLELLGEQNYSVNAGDSIITEPRANGQLLAIAEARLFDSHRSYFLSNALAQRSKPLVLQANANTLELLQIKEEQKLTITIDAMPVTLPIKVNSSLPDKVIAIPNSVGIKNNFPTAVLPAAIDQWEVAGA